MGRLLVPVALLVAHASIALAADKQVPSKEDPLEAHMTILGIVVERSTLEQARQALGKTEIRHNGGDAAASARGMCYSASDGTSLAFVSNSEMNGGTTIGRFQLVASKRLAEFSDLDGYVVPKANRPTCGNLASLSRSSATGGGLRLGMTPVEVKQLLGKPSKTGKDALEYQSEVQVFDRTDGAEKPPVRWTRFRSVLVEFKDGIAVAIRVGQGTTS